MNKADFNVIEGDCLSTLKSLEDNSVQCCVTSPPYYGLRDYGTGHWEGGDPNCPHYRTSKFSENDITGHKAMGESGQAVGDAIYKSVCPLCGAVRVDNQIGLEETPEQYIDRLVKVFHEVKRVLKEDGTLWLNIGDSYANKDLGNVKQKDLIGIPWMLAFALRADGWYLRQDIIWQKPNPMPESVRDRCTKSHEYLFLLSKSPKYVFNSESIQEIATGYDGRKDTMHKGSPKYEGAEIMPGNSIQSLAKGSHERWKFAKVSTDIKFGGCKYGENDDTHFQTYSGNEWQCNVIMDGDVVVPVRNKRDVWEVPVNSYKGAHFATYPIELVTPCILAGSNEGDTIIDPFSGSGTTGIVALANNRKYIGCELNPEYIKLSKDRLNEDLFGQAHIEESVKSSGGFEKFSFSSLIE